MTGQNYSFQCGSSGWFWAFLAIFWPFFDLSTVLWLLEVLQIIATCWKSGRRGCPLSLGHCCTFKSGGISQFGHHMPTQPMFNGLPILLHSTQALAFLTIDRLYLLLFYYTILNRINVILKKRNLKKKIKRGRCPQAPAPPFDTWGG